MDNTEIIIIGLGKIGTQLIHRLHARNVPVRGYDSASTAVTAHQKDGIAATTNIDELFSKSEYAKRIFWIALPQAVMEEFLFGTDRFVERLHPEDIIIDGGNSFYKDTMRRSKVLAKKGIAFFDCGTSGGIYGITEGFALMVGGPKEQWPIIEPLMKILSAGDNYAYLGRSGAGHFTKMVHNGIEYGMMESIGEGYAILKASPFDLDLQAVTKVYQKGSVIRSWLIDLCADIFAHAPIESVLGKIDETGEGAWTVTAASDLGVDARIVADALAVRTESQQEQNQEKFSNKIVALLRNRFGGHDVYYHK